jgi:hypothetical protein
MMSALNKAWICLLLAFTLLAPPLSAAGQAAERPEGPAPGSSPLDGPADFEIHKKGGSYEVAGHQFEDWQEVRDYMQHLGFKGSSKLYPVDREGLGMGIALSGIGLAIGAMASQGSNMQRAGIALAGALPGFCLSFSSIGSKRNLVNGFNQWLDDKEAIRDKVQDELRFQRYYQAPKIGFGSSSEEDQESLQLRFEQRALNSAFPTRKADMRALKSLAKDGFICACDLDAVEKAAREGKKHSDPLPALPKHRGLSFNRLKKGILLYKKGQVEKAEQFFGRICTRRCKNAEAWQYLGTCRYILGDEPGAVAAFIKASDLSPDNEELAQWLNSRESANASSQLDLPNR